MEDKIKRALSQDKNLQRFEDIDMIEIDADAKYRAEAMKLFKLDKGE